MDECKHGMIPEWYAMCKNLKTPEEEANEYEQNELDNFYRSLREK